MTINTNDVPVRDDIKATGDLNWMDFMDVGKSKEKMSDTKGKINMKR